MTKTLAKERVVMAAMKVQRTWENHSYFTSPKMFEAVVALDKACTTLKKAKRK